MNDNSTDATTEIAILRDQLARAVPTPPSSISIPISPIQEPSGNPSALDASAVPAELDSPSPRTLELSHPTIANTPRSVISSIPTLSPAAKRHSTILSRSSSTTNLSRSSSSRYVAAVVVPESPALLRSRFSAIARSPSRFSAINSNLAAKTRGFKLLHDLQARLRATDDKLGTKVPKRNVSAPMPSVTSDRTGAAAISPSAPSRATHARVIALTQESTPDGGHSADKTAERLISPNGWVLVSDGEHTPTSQGPGITQNESASPLLEYNSRSTSSTGSRALPARPGIPSPLTSVNSQLSKSTTSRANVPPPSRHAVPASKITSPVRTREGPIYRPMSPSLLPQPSRSILRSTSQAYLSASTSSPRPASRQGLREKTTMRSTNHVLRKGLPPNYPSNPTSKPLAMSVSTSSPSVGFHRSTRRSSLGVTEATLPPSGIPAPRTTPTRPISVPMFTNGTPPPVPRIPSTHLRESVKRNGMLGPSGKRERERPKHGFE